MTTLTTPTARLRSAAAAARPVEGQEIALIAVIAVLWLALGFATDTFFTGSNLRAILFNVAPIALIGIGMTAVIVTAGIDVSVGSAVAVVMVVVARLIRDVGVPAPAAVAIAVALGAVLGLVNGGLVAFGRIHPIIVTFATLNIFRFVALRIFDNRQVTGVPDTLAPAGGGAAGRFVGVVPYAWLVAVLLAGAMWWYMRSWPTGRHLYAIGGDALAARLAGVRVRRRQVFAYVLTGALVGLAGCVLIGSGGLVSQNAGEGLELQVIAAVVIGGTSIVGGRGTVLGTMLGALLVGTVTSAVTLLGWRSELTTLFVGTFILVAVGVDLVRARRREAR
jgi:ribose transport system permease protein